MHTYASIYAKANQCTKFEDRIGKPKLTKCGGVIFTGQSRILEMVCRLLDRIRLPISNYLARSAKVAERAICFTDRNFYLFFSFF